MSVVDAPAELVLPELVVPAFYSLPAFAHTIGDEVGDLCRMVGYGPDPEQQLLLDVTFGEDPFGLPAAFETCVVAPRQNLKTGFKKQCVIGWGWLLDVPLIVWSAHEFPTSREAFRDISNLIDGSDLLSRRVKKIYSGAGNEAIELMSGSRIVFKARTKTGGRGLTGNKVVLDEAFALQPTHMGSLLPVLITQGDAQVVYGSSAGLADSVILRDLRDRGRAGDEPKLAYAEWCDDIPGDCATPGCDHARWREGCKLDDPRRLARANTQYGKRFGLGKLGDFRRSMPPTEYAREFLGVWDEPAELDRAIPAADWAACLDDESQVVGRRHLALDVSPTQGDATIAIAGYRTDGAMHVEIVYAGRGTHWVLDKLIAGCADTGSPVALVKGSAAEALRDDLDKAGIEIHELTQSDYATACGEMLADVTSLDRLVRHRGQAELDEAVRGVCSRPSGERWVFDRRLSKVNITPICAATVAAHVAQHYVEPADPSIHSV